ncbi:MAG: LysR substrate-binding domain-containing protein [Caulobacteraceae bacterium]
MDKPAPLPPLATIRVFEAAARRLSFTKAADELGMTQAAVSYQIKALEDRLGVAVFRKAGRGVALTREGERLAEAATGAMTLLRDALAELHQGGDVLAITALPTLAATWLVPRLGAFQLAHPEFAVRLDTSNQLTDLGRDGFDLGLRAGKGQWPGVEAVRLFPSIYTPLYSPALPETCCVPTTPEDLRAMPLIGDPRDWSGWFHVAGLAAEPEEIVARAGYEVQQYDVAAALAGQGVALASPIFFADEIASGRLIRPFETIWYEKNDYWLAYPHSRRNTPKIRAFRDWITAAAAADPVVTREMARLGDPTP